MSNPSSLSHPKGRRYAEDDHHRITQNMTAYLKATHPWVMFISYVLFLACVLFTLIGVAVLILGTDSGIPVIFGLINLIWAVFALPLGIQLRGFGRTIAAMDEQKPMFPLEEALKRLKTFWKMLGIYALGFMLVFLIVLITQTLKIMNH